MSHDTDWSRSLESTTRGPSELDAPPGSTIVPCLTILWHPDPRRVGGLAPLSGLLTGKSVTLSRREPSFAPPDGGAPPTPLADPFLSRRPLRLVAAPDGGIRIDRRRTGTTLCVEGRPVETECMLSAEDLARGAILLLADRVALVLHRMALRLERPLAFGLVGETDALVEVRQEIVRLARHRFPVLLRGESGTGKELVARALHDAGPRQGSPFVSVNMGALPPTLAAAELFGAARGAYTGADRSREGFFQRADGGTLFLDEIGAMPSELQVLLFRVLESGRIQPVGAASPVAVDVRVVAATDADLEMEAARGAFRTPLLHRLSTYEVELPPLRARREDFGRLFLHFLRQELAVGAEAWRLDDRGPDSRPWIGAPLISRLAAHPWPGNVRQLRNVSRQLVVRSHGEDEIWLTSKIERLLSEVPDPVDKAGTPRIARYRKPSEISQGDLLDALRANHWHIRRTAEQLGVSRTTLYALIEACPGIRKASELGREEIERCRTSCSDDLSAMAERLEVSNHGLRLRLRELGIRQP